MASLQLKQTARRAISEEGSIFIDNFLYGDGWMWIFEKGGKTLFESIVYNTGSVNNSASPMYTYFNFPEVSATQKLSSAEDSCKVNSLI